MIQTPAHKLLPMLAMLLLLAGACSSDSGEEGEPAPERVPASDFDQDCTYDDECVVVVETTCLECAPCIGGEGAINRDAEDEYTATHDSYSCDGMSQAHCNNNCGFTNFAACVQGQCTAVTPPWNSDPIDDSCESSDNCMLAPQTSDKNCPSCTCSSEAVNTQAYLDAIADANDLDSFECSLRPDQCEPCEYWRPTCTDGVCVAEELQEL